MAEPQLTFSQPLDRRQRIDLIYRFIRSKTYDPRKAQRISALMAGGWLDAVESYLDHDPGLDDPHPAMSEFPDCVGPKPLGHLGDFSVRQSRIGFTDVEQFRIIFRATNRKSIIRQYVVSLAVTKFDSRNYDIESRQRLLEFQPFTSTAAGFVERRRIFNHQAFIASGARGVKFIVEG